MRPMPSQTSVVPAPLGAVAAVPDELQDRFRLCVKVIRLARLDRAALLLSHG